MSRNESGDRVRGVIGQPGDQIVIHNDREDSKEAMAEMMVELRRIGECLDEVVERLAGEPPRTKYMTKQEVAQFLRESVRQVDRRRSRGEIPEGVRIGRRRLFLRDEIEALDLDELAACGGAR